MYSNTYHFVIILKIWGHEHDTTNIESTAWPVFKSNYFLYFLLKQKIHRNILWRGGNRQSYLLLFVLRKQVLCLVDEMIDQIRVSLVQCHQRNNTGNALIQLLIRTFFMLIFARVGGRLFGFNLSFYEMLLFCI